VIDYRSFINFTDFLLKGYKIGRLGYSIFEP
jgi:hypothetical protein